MNTINIEPSDIVTIAGVYRQRTLWQWLTRQPRQLQQFTVNHSYCREMQRKAQEYCREMQRKAQERQP